MEILQNSIKNVGLEPSQRIITEAGDVFHNIAEVLANDEKFTKQIRENISSQFIKIIVENAKNLLPSGEHQEEGESKFGMEANLGDTVSFFGGLSKLIGDPHPDLVNIYLFIFLSFFLFFLLFCFYFLFYFEFCIYSFERSFG